MPVCQTDEDRRERRSRRQRCQACEGSSKSAWRACDAPKASLEKPVAQVLCSVLCVLFGNADIPLKDDKASCLCKRQERRTTCKTGDTHKCSNNHNAGLVRHLPAWHLCLFDRRSRLSSPVREQTLQQFVFDTVNPLTNPRVVSSVCPAEQRSVF